MASMGCIVALPDKALFQGEITYANIPGTDGYFGVLPGHELTVSLNREGGVVTLTIGENEKREFLVMGGATSVQAVYVPADDLTDPAPATTFTHLDAKTVLSRSIAELGIYPAVDPLESTSRALDPEIVGQEHYDVAMGVQQILQQYKDLQDIIAILGMDELSEDQKLTVNRARKVQKFLGQPFHVAEVFTGLPGVYVKVEDTVRSFKEILDGKCDHIPEQCFVNKGAIEQVYEAYDAMQKEGN